jgi:hypothetical protein
MYRLFRSLGCWPKERKKERTREEQQKIDKKHADLSSCSIFFLQVKTTETGKPSAGISRESDGEAE